MQQRLEKLQNNGFPVFEGSDATADFFYSSQGRTDPNFDDQNAGLVDRILEDHPDTGSLQMETFHMYHLAQSHNRAKQDDQAMRVAACAIVLAQRQSDEFLTNARKYEIEVIAGKACLSVLVSIKN